MLHTSPLRCSVAPPGGGRWPQGCRITLTGQFVVVVVVVVPVTAALRWYVTESGPRLTQNKD